jgi:hypothetical protein
VTELKTIGPGLYRWTVRHPAWTPDALPESPADWPRAVGCVLFEADDATVLIDPLLPTQHKPGFLNELDRRVEARGQPVAILTTIGFHRRSRATLAERYGATTSRAKRALPSGVESHPIRGAGETMFWLAKHGTLVPGDRIIGAAGRLRMCPESWLAYLPSNLGLRELRMRLRPLLELPIENVLVSHGEPVLGDGRAALADALGG